MSAIKSQEDFLEPIFISKETKNGYKKKEKSRKAAAKKKANKAALKDSKIKAPPKMKTKIRLNPDDLCITENTIKSTIRSLVKKSREFSQLDLLEKFDVDSMGVVKDWIIENKEWVFARIYNNKCVCYDAEYVDWKDNMDGVVRDQKAML